MPAERLPACSFSKPSQKSRERVRRRIERPRLHRGHFVGTRFAMWQVRSN